MKNNIQDFYAMEYIYLIGNRILKVWITEKYIFAAKVKGLTSETSQYGFVNNSSLVINPKKRKNPKNYVNRTEENRYSSLDFNLITPKKFIQLNPSNFVITRSKIKEVFHNPKKKWGMGSYPHNGRIIVCAEKEITNRKRKREFILIGSQDAADILGFINH